MTSGLPDLYIVNESGALTITDEGRKIQSNNKFTYLDFLRHQINEQLNEAYREKRECDLAYQNVCRNYERTRDESYGKVGRGIPACEVDRIIDEQTGWDQHPSLTYWRMPYQQGILNHVRILEASRDLVVGRMNKIGSHG